MHELRRARPARAPKAGPVTRPRPRLQAPQHEQGADSVPAVQGVRRQPAGQVECLGWRGIQRLVESSGLLEPRERASCPEPGCGNHGISIAEGGKGAYRKRGRTRTHEGQRYQCKACGQLFVVTAPVRLHDRNKRFAADVLSRIANKSPARCSIRGSGVRSTQSYYAILRFIHDRCRALSGSIDRALMDGRLALPEEVVTQTDAQEYTLNWVSRLDRRNVVLSGYATIDFDSHFVLGMHASSMGASTRSRSAATLPRSATSTWRRHSASTPTTGCPGTN